MCRRLHHIVVNSYARFKILLLPPLIRQLGINPFGNFRFASTADGNMTFLEPETSLDITNILIFGRKILPQNGACMTPLVDLVILLYEFGQFRCSHIVTVARCMSFFNISFVDISHEVEMAAGRRWPLWFGGLCSSG